MLVARTGRYKWLLVGSIAILGVGTPLMTQLTSGHAAAHRLAVDVHRRPRRRPDVLGVHDRDPELGAVPPDGRRDLEPDLLPPDRRLGRPRVRRHDLRADAPGRPGPADGRRGRPAADIATFFGGARHGRARHERADRRRRPRPADRGGVPELAPPCRRSWRASTGRSASRSPRPSTSASIGAVVSVVAALAIKELPLRAANTAPAAAKAQAPRPTRPPRASTDLATSRNGPGRPSGRRAVPIVPSLPSSTDDRPPPLPARAPGDRRRRRRRSGRRHPVADLPPGAMRRVSFGELDVLLAHTRPGLVATDDRCPHMSAPLSIGGLDGCVVACPLHNGRFDLCTGDGGPDADHRRPLPRRHATSRSGARPARSPRWTRPGPRPRRAS